MAFQNKNGVTIHSAAEYAGMRKSGQLAASVLDMITEHVQVGVTTNELNDLCHNMIIQAGAIPAPLNYKGFPKSICTSVNHVVCHGIPEDKPLRAGDIVNVDVTTIVDGWYGDTSRTFWVGDKIPKSAQILTQVTYDAMMLGIEQVRPGATLGDIGHAIQQHAEKHNYGIVEDYCGHGLGRVFHTAPNVVHYGQKGKGMVLEEGMFFTIEPMINIGKKDTILNKFDGWTVTTKDKSLSAQFEHSLAVTADGFEIFTISPKGLHCPPLF
jgi:methionyl aminopeptidase